MNAENELLKAFVMAAAGISALAMRKHQRERPEQHPDLLRLLENGCGVRVALLEATNEVVIECVDSVGTGVRIASYGNSSLHLH